MNQRKTLHMSLFTFRVIAATFSTSTPGRDVRWGKCGWLLYLGNQPCTQIEAHTVKTSTFSETILFLRLLGVLTLV